MQLSTTIAGIPCTVKVTGIDYQPPFDGPAHLCDSDVDYWGGWEFEWEVCDSKGRPAAWLQRKMTSADEDRINSQIIQLLREDHENI